MSQEIRKETDWLGNEKDGIYEDGNKVGETRHEKDWIGNPVDRTYDSDGNRVSQTTHETSWWGGSKEVTRDTDGSKISETHYDKTIFGETRGTIKQGGRNIGELRTEKDFWGNRTQVLRTGDVDLRTRSEREAASSSGSSGSSRYSGGSDGSYSGGSSSSRSSSSSSTQDAVVIGCLAAFLIPLTIASGIYWSSHRNKPESVKKTGNETVVATRTNSSGLQIERRISAFSNYLESHRQLSGNFRDYQLVVDPALGSSSGESEQEIAYLGPNSLYVFYTNDEGKTWSPFPPRKPFFQILARECSEFSSNFQRSGGRSPSDIEYIIDRATTMRTIEMNEEIIRQNERSIAAERRAGR